MRDETEFNIAKEAVLGKESLSMGIGTLSEKSIHRILKKFYEPDSDYYETALDGYVADIYKEGMVYEIQTANFKKMRDKLSVFLNNYKVKIVHPIYVKKYLVTVAPKTGEIISRRVSPLKGSIYDIFYELYGIRDFFNNANLSIDAVLLEIDEYRTQSKKNKRGIHREDKLPTKYLSTYEFECVADFMSLIPVELGEVFTIPEFAACAKIPYQTASITVNVLAYLGLLKRDGKIKNAYLYRVCEN